MDEELDLGAITGRRGPEQGGRYRLAGIIYHLGISMQSGHYKAEFRDDQGRWWRADDTQVRLLVSCCVAYMSIFMMHVLTIP